MILIVVAHRGEGQAFFQQESWTALPEPFHQSTFSHQDQKLMLHFCGEGAWNAYASVIKLLNFLQFQTHKIFPAVEQIFNLGIAGALRSSVKLHQIYAIRTVYGQSVGEFPEFHSYTASLGSEFAPDLGRVDCLSFYERVYSLDKRQKLAPFAELVDRELWAIARAAKEFHLSWQAIKMISDAENSNVTCQQIAQEAAFFSEKLVSCFYQNLGNTKKIYAAENQEVSFLEIEKLITSSLKNHATFAQKKILQKKINCILLQQKCSLLDFWSEHNRAILEIIPPQMSPKSKTKVLLTYLSNLLNPHQLLFDAKHQFSEHSL